MVSLASTLGKGLSNVQVAEAYATYGHLVLRRCRLLLRDSALADDALQEVFVKLMRWGDSFLQAEAPLRWLYRTADRVCFDQLQRKKKRAEVPELDTDIPAPPGVPPEMLDLMTRFLRRLNDLDRRIAVLAYVDGLSQGEIAEELGKSRQTINKRLQNIRVRAEKFGGLHG